MANRHPSRIGKRIGRLTIIALQSRSKSRYRLWRCRCDCGREEDIPTYRLRVVTACAVCRRPKCRNCGASLPRPTQSRTCSARCRRERNAMLAQESRARAAITDPNYTIARAKYNRDRIGASPLVREIKRASDRDSYRRQKDDPFFIERRKQQWSVYYAAKSSDADYRARQRYRKAKARTQRELDAMRRDLDTMDDVK